MRLGKQYIKLLNHKRFGIGLSIMVGIFLLSINYLTHFHIGINDYWGFLLLAEHLDTVWPKSLYNGLFPIGYMALLRLGLRITQAQIIQLSFLINLLLASLLIYYLWKLLKKQLKGAWLLLALITYFIPSEAFYMLQQPGPYVIFNLFCLLGMLKYYASTKSKHDLFSVGILFGFASLFRVHAFLPLTCIILSDLLVQGVFSIKIKSNQVKSILLVVFGYLLIGQVQFWINHYAGQAVWSTNHSLTNQGINWDHFSPSDAQQHLLAPILNNPIHFFKLYAYHLLQALPWLTPSFLLLITHFYFRKLPPIWLRLSICCLLFTLIIRLHTTHRWLLPILPLIVLQLGYVFQLIWESLRLAYLKVFTLGCAGILTYFTLSYVRTHHYAFLKNNYVNHQHYTALEALMFAHQNKVLTPFQYFSNSYAIYLPHSYPFKVYGNGGWLRGIDWFYAEVAPNLSLESLESFIADCHTDQTPISHLILDAQAKQLSPFLGEIYEGKHPRLVKLLGEVNQIRIFEIVGLEKHDEL
ncbi:MAG: hypothetical protein ACPGJS_17180 [Flammeovirgaceae bacterium]